MITKFGYAVPDTILYNFTTNTSGIPPRDYQNLLRGVKSDYPWPGVYKTNLPYIHVEFVLYFQLNKE